MAPRRLAPRALLHGLIASLCLAGLAACGSPGTGARVERTSSADAPATPPQASANNSSSPATSTPRVSTNDDARPRLVILGDSLTAGLGLDLKDAYPTVLQHKLDDAGIDLRIINAGISGDTSAGGLSRVDLALEGDVRVLLVALGGNDGLRALPVEALRSNLAAIIERGQARGATVVLAGMEAPPNFGREYVTAFRQVYAALATQYKVTLIPFLLDGVAGVERLNQDDGIHPTAEGARMVADHVWPILAPVAKDAASRRPAQRGEAGRG